MERQGNIGSRQIKAARALLDWSQDDLADATRLSIATIRKLELGYISPRYTTTSVLRQVLEGAGIEFVDPDGVRRRPDEIAMYQGSDGNLAFFDDVCQTVKRTGSDFVLIETPEISFLPRANGNNYKTFERILDSNGSSSIKCLLTDVFDFPLSTPRLEFRLISKHYVDPMPFCVYGDKFAMIVAGNSINSKIVVLRSPCASQASKRQFVSMWEKATPVFDAAVNGSKTEKRAC